MAADRYVPALRFRRLTGPYDPVVGLTTRESEFKGRLLDQAELSPGRRVLDLGCGTGTLAIEAKRAEPGADPVGLDGDPELLERARARAEAAGVTIRFDRCLSTELPYPDDSFDVVLATLFFHHLTPDGKRATARELENTAENAAGELPAIFAEGRLEAATETERLRTVFGTLSLYRARAPGGSDGDR